MELILYLALIVVLLAINIFFVVAEFSVVKVRPSRIAELVANGDPRAKLVARIQTRIDEFIAVVQVGITMASVALGMVGGKLAVTVAGAESAGVQAIASGVSLLLVSGLHVVIGEQVPKVLAIRVADRCALATARPLLWSRLVFLPILGALNGATNACLRLIGAPRASHAEEHSEDELRIILEQGQSRGLMSFRRLLFIENVFDLGELTVKDAMRPRSQVKALTLGAPWAENAAVFKQSRFSRFPILTPGSIAPLGVLHIKDLILTDMACSEPDLAALARSYLTVPETQPLEQLLAEMQRKRIHVAIVTDATGTWTGLATMEDVIEEIIGTIRDEFEVEEPVTLSDCLNVRRIVPALQAPNLLESIRLMIDAVPDDELPLPKERIVKAVQDRERQVATYLGNGIAMPHARLPDLAKPVVLFARSEIGVPVAGADRAHLLFLLLTPAGQPRVHQRLQARIAGLLDSSEYVVDRLKHGDPIEIVEAVRTGEQAALG
jgi:CBS domain containing-hemolysin-like protein